MKVIANLILLIFLFINIDISFAQEKYIKKVESTLEDSLNLPLISDNDANNYFVRSIKSLNEYYYGGYLSKSKFWFESKLDSIFQSKFYQCLMKETLMGITQNQSYSLLVSKSRSKSQIAKLKGIFQMKNASNSSQSINFGGKKINLFHSFFTNKNCNFLIVSLKGLRDSYGGYDLYISFRSKNDRWSKFQNLGSSINSHKDEICPFYDDFSQKLYFSSDRCNGLGGMDIYYSKRIYNSWKLWEIPVNMGNQINSETDEVFFTISKNGKGHIITNNKYNKAELFDIKLLEKESYLLNNQELKTLLGIDMSQCKLFFNIKTNYLKNSSKELLWHIFNKLNINKKLKLKILIDSSDTKNYNQHQRYLLEIYKYLESLGLNRNKFKIQEIPPNLIDEMRDRSLLFRIFK